MRKALVLLLLAALVGLALGMACDQGERKVTLRFKFKPGMEIEYKQTASGTLRVFRSDSLVSDRANDYTAMLTWYVRRVLEDGTAEIVESKTFNLTETETGESGRVDTVKEERDIIMYVKPNGKVEDLETSESGENKSLTYLKNYLEQGQPVFPDRELGEGYSWIQTTKVILPDGPMDASTTYEVKSFVRERGYDCVVVAYDGNLIIPLEKMHEKSYKLIQGVDNIQASGHIYFAYEEGLVVRQTEKWVLDRDASWSVVEVDTTMASMKNVVPGDTVVNNIKIEYDVDHVLVDLARE
ncbi:hypothetical protein GF377_08355 [candidate division GN15 bacterium]|nr:hypothetical protein [candidate division GN15 bacterium]